MKIGIIGGGIGGLTLAWYLQKAGVPYDLFEADARPGGNLHSLATPEGYLLEVGPNSLQLSPELQELLADLGLTDQIQDAAAVSQNRYVLRGGRYQVLPSSPPTLLTNGFFSLKAKWQLLKEFRKPAAPIDTNETVAHFFRRRFGPEIVDYAVNPFMAGIYAGDPEQLLIHKTFPQLPVLEQQFGSVLRGFAKSSKGAGRRRIITLQNGIQTLTDTLAAKLTNYQPGTAVTAVSRATDGTYQLELKSPQGLEAAPGYSHLALALPTYAAAPLLEPLFPQAAAALAAVYYPPMCAVYSAYDRASVAHPLNGFGALNPKVEGTYAAGSIWTSSIYPNRVPAGQVLFTTFVGGAQYEDTGRQPDDAQKAAVHAELSKFYGITGAPRWQFRYSWPRSIPQFDGRIVAAHAAADALTTDNIVAVANWRAGVGVPDCIRYARKQAEALAAH
ncbi:protoporphyrinogen oxidase [Hymenobacter properus]|uniref:Coproporphyrinogen III oxidase n=1 Tax=Hymenobacter properus TaxID=2791026 RepID=A0A931BHU2_9BACT|nr:protoporphyrinogen oxidase [Hymenobacter properus]MBF9144200.1 protoporphyrinogen oxidase [Hymenobacter properus]MBR7723018.1 protoporphyrinogen oxidase [Microvirga sp. SRT04]